MTTFTASEVRELVGTEDIIARARVDNMLRAYADHLEADEKAVPVAIVKDSDALYTGWLSWAGKSLPPETPLYTHPASADAERLAEALRFYADGNHLLLGDPGAWDTVSGEPQNWLCDEAGTATIEDGSIAKQALAAHSAQAQPPAASVTDEMVERARSAFVQADDGSTGITDAIRAALLAAHLAYPQPSRDAKDAARYRWMRGMRNRERAADLAKHKMNLDAAIDAAMAKESGR